MLPQSKFAYVYQYAVAFSATLLVLSAASAYGWTSPVIPMLMSEDSPIPITSDEGSWIVAFMVLGTCFAPYPTAWLADKFGRKLTLLGAAIPLSIGWILTMVATSVEVIYVARFVSGLSYGIVYSALPMYLGEIASDKVRGSIGTLLTVMAKTGILLVYCVGPYVSLLALGGILFVPTLIFVGTFIWAPKSPYFLLAQNRFDEAEQSLKKFRRCDDVSEDFEKMKKAIAISQENKKQGTFKQMFKRSNVKSLYIVLGLGACQQLCGSQAVVAYSQTIFKAIGSQWDPSEATIVLGVIQLVTAAISSSIVDRWGRRPLLLLSTAGVCVGNLVVGLYFFLDSLEDIDTQSVQWLPITMIMIYIIFYTIGLATVPFAVLGEVFPSNIKAVATATYTVFASVIGFGVSKLFQVVSDNWGYYVTFWIFSVSSAFFVVFIYFILPETKGKPLEVILQELGAKKPKKDADGKQSSIS